jgi:hypothetical protein
VANARRALSPTNAAAISPPRSSFASPYAAAAAPYVHRRKPIALEVGGRFEFLSAEEIKARRQLLLEEIRKRAGVSQN